MMRFALTTAAALLLLTPKPSQAQANPFIFIGGGITVPMGDFGDSHKSGWMGTAGIGFSVGGSGKLAIGGEGYYGRNSLDGPSEDATNLYGGSAWLAYRLGQPGRVAPYVIGSGGFLVAKFDPPTGPGVTDTEFAWSAGGGVDIPLSGSVSLYIEGRYMARGDVRFIPIFAGLSFSFGGGGGGM
jgi:opacity protein-like surface antigen